MAEKTSYGTIFKTTFLFGFVQVYKAVITVIKNKIAALLIGPEGMGIVGIYQTVVSLIQTGAGLGVNQSAVRDVSEARGQGDTNGVSRIISIVNKVILYTGLLGCVTTLCLSYWLSEWTFGDHAHIVAYCFIALVVALNIVDETKQAILKGMRQLRSLAKAGIIGSTAGLLITAPLYYYFGKEGIIPSLLIASIVAVLVSNHFVEKIEYDKITVSFKNTVQQATPMIKMGVALMMITFLQLIVSLILNAFIRLKGGLGDVGLYSAGFTIINGYFGVIITALLTDYYPRIAAVNNDNEAIQEELNRQSLVTLVLSCPMFVLFMIFLPFFIRLLYTNEFMPTIEFIKYGIFFTLISMISNQVDMILVAKFQSRIMLVFCIIFRVIHVVLGISLYSLWGLKGLGITYLILGIIHISAMSFIVNNLYKIRFSRLFLQTAGIVLLFSISSTIIQSCTSGTVYYFLSIILLLLSVCFSYVVSRKYLQIDFISIVKDRMHQKRM